jgi:RNA polymerase sigma factor for flagellar operon FliA
LATEQEIEEVLKEHLSLVKFYARRWSKALPSGLDLEDLMQVGNLALVEAMDRFRDDGGGSFRTYAGWRVNGAIGDEIRRMRWVPRHMESEKLIKLIDARRAQSLPVTAEALAEVTGSSVEKIHEWEQRMDQARRNHVSLTEAKEDTIERTFDSQGHRDIDVEDEREDTEKIVMERERMRLLHAAVDLLPDRLRTVITLHYFEEMTNAAIATILMVTESRISQMMKQAEKMLGEAVAVIDLVEPTPFSVVNPRPVALRDCTRCHQLYVCTGHGKYKRDYCSRACRVAGAA